MLCSGVKWCNWCTFIVVNHIQPHNHGWCSVILLLCNTAAVIFYIDTLQYSFKKKLNGANDWVQVDLEANWHWGWQREQLSLTSWVLMSPLPPLLVNIVICALGRVRGAEASCHCCHLTCCYVTLKFCPINTELGPHDLMLLSACSLIQECVKKDRIEREIDRKKERERERAHWPPMMHKGE